jgi:hypothetical protein
MSERVDLRAVEFRVPAHRFFDSLESVIRMVFRSGKLGVLCCCSRGDHGTALVSHEYVDGLHPRTPYTPLGEELVATCPQMEKLLRNPSNSSIMGIVIMFDSITGAPSSFFTNLDDTRSTATMADYQSRLARESPLFKTKALCILIRAALQCVAGTVESMFDDVPYLDACRQSLLDIPDAWAYSSGFVEAYCAAIIRLDLITSDAFDHTKYHHDHCRQDLLSVIRTVFPLVTDMLACLDEIQDINGIEILENEKKLLNDIIYVFRYITTNSPMYVSWM